MIGILLVRYVILLGLAVAVPRWVFRRTYSPSLEMERDLEALGRNKARLAAWKVKQLTSGKK